MKEIGEKLKETRVGMGISLEEAAEDLKLSPSKIEDIEEGRIEAFKDLFYLKYFIRDYSKYLGLKYEDMVDEFNEFLFDYTSKISIKDIKEAQKKAGSKPVEEKRVASPYTVSTYKKPVIISKIFYLVVVVLILIIMYLIISFIKKDDIKEDNDNNIEATNVISLEGEYFV